MEINEFLAIGTVGVLLSAAVEVVQAKWGTGSVGTKFTTVGLAIALGTVYVLFRETDWWMTVLSVLASASMVYAFITKDLLSNHE